MKKVILIAEKGSQLREYMQLVPAGKKSSVKPYHFEVQPCEMFPAGMTALAARGFLLELKKPGDYPGLERLKQWTIEDVPFPLPFPYHYVPSTEPGAAEQLNHLKKVIRGAISQYGAQNIEFLTATDIDESGAFIAQQIYNYSLTDAEMAQAKFTRLWVSSIEATALRTGFRNIQSHDLTSRMSESSRAKTESDFILGLGATRLITLVAKQKLQEGIDRINNGNALIFSKNVPKQAITITVDDILPQNSAARAGRVQLTTLHFIVNRENEIANFREQPFYELYADFESANGPYKGKLSGFKTHDFQEVTQKLQAHQLNPNGVYAGTVTDIVQERKKRAAPKLHSLTSLQALANRKWKLSASDVLECCQSLYLKKITTYPRTDQEKISLAEFSYLAEYLDQYKEAFGFKFENTYMKPRKVHVSNEPMEHHALILTRKIPSAEDMAALTTNERLIYMEIARSSVAIFAPDYEYDQTTITTTVNGLPFQSVGKVERVRGYEVIWDAEKAGNPVMNDATEGEGEGEDDEGQQLPLLTVHQQVNSTIVLKEGVTKPPLRYTEANLLEAMKNAGKFMEGNEEAQSVLKAVKGIGTSATRADIIKSLKQAEYVVVKKNRFIPTAKALIVCRLTEGTMFSNPEITAKWEVYLRSISDGASNASADEFIKYNIEFVRKFKEWLLQRAEHPDIQLFIEHMLIQLNAQYEKARIVCPRCKTGEVRQISLKNNGGALFTCSSYGSDAACGFKMADNFGGKRFTAAQVKQLLTKGITSSELKLKNKENKEYQAKIRFNVENGRLEPVFSDKKPKKKGK